MYVSVYTSRNDILIIQFFFLVVVIFQVLLTNLQSDGTTFAAPREPQQSVPEDQGPSIALPPSLFNNLITRDVGVFFTHYATAVFFPLAEGIREDIVIGTSVIGASVANVTVRNLENNITVVFQLQNTVSAVACVYLVYMLVLYAYISQLRFSDLHAWCSEFVRM